MTIQTVESEIGKQTVDARAAYAAIWRQTPDRYSRETHAQATPLLSSLIRSLPSVLPAPARVLDFGAGAGDHSVILATQPGLKVTALDSSSDATTVIAAKARSLGPQFGDSSSLDVVTADVFEHVGGLGPDSLDALYGNSVIHFMSTEERVRLLALSALAQAPGKFFAASLKDYNDALLKQGTTRVVGENEAGILAIPSDGIKRLFVSNPEALSVEFGKAGYNTLDILQWRVPGYDIPGEDGSFVGIFAQRR